MPYVLGGRADTAVSVGAALSQGLFALSPKAIQSSVRTPFAVSPALGSSFSGEKLKL